MLHRVGFTTEDQEFWVAQSRCDAMLEKILVDTGVQHYQIWLSDSPANNFRYSIYPSYKANRTAPKPRHHEDLKAYIIQEWGAKFAEGMEADDYLGILQDEEHSTTVICSIDKDLKQIPGLHYNFVTEKWDEVSDVQAEAAFYKQIVIGDTTDNVPGVKGIGPVKASRKLTPTDNVDVGDYVGVVPHLLRDLAFASLIKEWGKPWDRSKEAALWGQILLSGRLLKIKRSFKEPIWGSQLSSPIQEYLSLYTLPTEVVSDPFMELIPPERKDGCPLVGHLMELTSPQEKNVV